METTPAGLAPFERVAESVRRSIRVGSWKPGDKLPSNRDLAKEHGVSLATLQKALSLLQEQGWLIPRASVGVFVAELPANGDPVTLAHLSDRVAELHAEIAELKQRMSRMEDTSD